MRFKKYYLVSALYIISLVVTGAVALWSFTSEDMVVSRYIFIFIWVILLLFFFRHFYHATQIINRLIESMQGNDVVFLPETNNIFGKEFSKLFSYLNNRIETVKIEKEEQYHFFKTAINQSGSGIIVFDEKGKIKLCNKAALKIFGLETLNNISTFALFNPLIPEKLQANRPGSFILGATIGGQLFKLSWDVNKFIIRGENLGVTSVQNISRELEREEVEAWKKLMHVITHEIMNSVTPMKTLTYSLLDIYDQNGKPPSIEKLESINLEDTHNGLQALSNRMKGLMRFVESFRKLYKIPEPEFSNINLRKLFNELKLFFDSSIKQMNIQFSIAGDVQALIYADREMMFQLFTNLIKNAMDALGVSEQPSIFVEWSQNNIATTVKIKDNGCGMDEVTLKDVFVPFFTTKKEGTGIGLYYSRQIVFLHKGRINIASKPGEGTEVIVEI